MRLGLLLLASCATFPACASTPVATAATKLVTAVELSGLERQIIDAINAIRTEAGLKTLMVSTELCRVARAHSAYQARTARSGHEGEGGSSAAERARAGGIAYQTLAENVAMNYGYDDAAATAVSAWMKSAPHRKNILSAEFSQTGVGVVTTAEGRSYFTQLFLAPFAPR